MTLFPLPRSLDICPFASGRLVQEDSEPVWEMRWPLRTSARRALSLRGEGGSSVPLQKVEYGGGGGGGGVLLGLWIGTQGVRRCLVCLGNIQVYLERVRLVGVVSLRLLVPEPSQQKGATHSPLVLAARWPCAKLVFLGLPGSEGLRPSHGS